MKTKKIGLFLSLMVLVLVASACGKSGTPISSPIPATNSPTSASSGEEVSVVSSNWKWELSKTTFKKGEPVTFVLTGKEGVHGFSIEGTTINQQIAAGETKKVTWTPDKSGEFTIKCSIVCGTGHANMVQKITVN